MAYLGMDDTVVETEARALDRSGHEIGGVIQATDSLIAALEAEWRGNDAAQLIHTWRQQHRPRGQHSAQVLREFAALLTRNVAEQRGASGGSGALASHRGSLAGSPGRDGVIPVRDLVDLAAAGYSNGKAPDGYPELSDAELKKLGIDPRDLHDTKTGFDAKVMRGPDGKLVVSFGGTEGWLKNGQLVPTEDAQTDAIGAVYLTRQTEQAAVLGKIIANAEGKENVTFVGHSLGGRLAAVASVATGAQAVTFNSAGVSNSELMYAMTVAGKQSNIADYVMGGLHDLTMGKISGGAMVNERSALTHGQITNYTSQNDPLTGAQDYTPAPEALGHRITVKDPSILGGAHDVESIRRHY